jgi:hypothetical protein
MEYATLVILSINSFLLIGIAGSLAKLIGYLKSGEIQKNDWQRIIQAKKDFKVDTKNYTDYPDNSNWDGIPVNKNWDGVEKSR